MIVLDSDLFTIKGPYTGEYARLLFLAATANFPLLTLYLVTLIVTNDRAQLAVELIDRARWGLRSRVWEGLMQGQRALGVSPHPHKLMSFIAHTRVAQANSMMKPCHCGLATAGRYAWIATVMSSDFLSTCTFEGRFRERDWNGTEDE